MELDWARIFNLVGVGICAIIQWEILKWLIRARESKLDAEQKDGE